MPSAALAAFRDVRRNSVHCRRNAVDDCRVLHAFLTFPAFTPRHWANERLDRIRSATGWRNAVQRRRREAADHIADRRMQLKEKRFT